jgi:hypothetical protein
VRRNTNGLVYNDDRVVVEDHAQSCNELRRGMSRNRRIRQFNLKPRPRVYAI